jgi:AAA domain
VQRCRSVLLFCEDDLDEMHARQEEINRSYGCTFADLGDMLWVPRLGTDTTLMTFENGHASRTPAFYELFTVIKRHHAQLAVWDTLTDVFGGSEIDRGQARRFVQEGPGYVAREIDGSVICCAHPSLSGINSGKGTSGSTGWDGAFRSRLYLSAPREDDNGAPSGTDERLLTRMKSNWAKVGATIPMCWRDGVFITDGPPGEVIGSIERRTCDHVFIDMLCAITNEGREVSDKPNAGIMRRACFRNVLIEKDFRSPISPQPWNDSLQTARSNWKNTFATEISISRLSRPPPRRNTGEGALRAVASGLS